MKSNNDIDKNLKERKNEKKTKREKKRGKDNNIYGKVTENSRRIFV